MAVNVMLFFCLDYTVLFSVITALNCTPDFPYLTLYKSHLAILYTYKFIIDRIKYQILHSDHLFVVKCNQSVTCVNYSSAVRYKMRTKNLIELSGVAFSDSDKNTFRRRKFRWFYRLKFVLQALAYRSHFHKLQAAIKAPYLDLLLEQHPKYLQKIFRPYVDITNGTVERINLICEHYDFITEQLPEKTALTMYSSAQGLEVTRFLVGEQEYSVSLGYCAKNHKEGDLGLKLLDETGNVFYALTFSVSDNIGEGRTIIVGGLQGPKSSPEINERIKYFTKQHHGQRPKDMMIKMLTIIANVWDVKRLLLVNNKAHIYQCNRYKKKTVTSNYDAHWESLGAEKYNESLYELSPLEIRKNLEDIKRTKRAMYRKRYEWLDALAEEIARKLALSKVM